MQQAFVLAQMQAPSWLIEAVGEIKLTVLESRTMQNHTQKLQLEFEAKLRKAMT